MLTLLLSIALTSAPAQAEAPSDLAARISEEKGRIVAVNFWAVWCEPCKREIPMLARVAREYAAQNVVFLGASIDDAEEVGKAQDFARRKGVGYPLIFGVKPPEMVGFRLGDAVPVTVILDQQGIPRFRLVGEINEKDLRKRLDWMIEPDGKAAPEELLLPAGMSTEHFRDMHEQGVAAEHSLEEQRAREEGGSAVPG